MVGHVEQRRVIEAHAADSRAGLRDDEAQKFAGMDASSVGPECSPVFFREHMRIEVSYPLLALLRDLQMAECIADIGVDRLPEKSGVRCS